MNIATNLEWSAFFFPDRPVISEGDSVTGYARLNRKANRVATALINLKVQPGDHIGIFAPNSGDWIAFYFGVLKAGAVPVTLSSQLSKDELALLLNHCRPKMIFTSSENLDSLEGFRASVGLQKIICPGGDLDMKQLTELGSASFKARDRDRGDTAAILYTGGTTGTPKGVMLSHENINTSIHNVVFNERSTHEDRALCFLPFNHVFGQMHILMATILSGGCLEMLPAFDMDKILWLLAEGRVTKLFAVPTIYTRFLGLDRLEERLGKVRYCFSAAASMAADTVRQWKAQSGLAIYEGYGMTEAAPVVTYNHYYHHVIGSVGTAAPGVEILIRDQDGRTLEQGREVLAIPGSIHNPLARGCHSLIRAGAKLVETADDVVEEIAPLVGAQLESADEAQDNAATPTETLDSDYTKLLDAMGFDPVDQDTLTQRSGLTTAEVSSMLLILELKGVVVAAPGGLFYRTDSTGNS